MTTNERDKTACFDSEVIRDYAADRLDAERADSFEQHYFACERCWNELRQALEIRAALSAGRDEAAGRVPSRPEPRPAERGRRRLPAWLAAAAVVALAAVGIWQWQPGLDSERTLRGGESTGLDLRVEMTELGLQAGWAAVPGAEAYLFELFDDQGVPLLREETSVTSWSGELDAAVAARARRARVSALDSLRQTMAASRFIELPRD